MLVAIVLAFAPALAEAKAGSGSSMGSRGSKTYTPNTAKPIERSITPPPAAAPAPVYTPAPQPQAAPLAAPAMRQGFFERHPFLGGVMGGFIGAGIGALLFGGGHMFGGGMGGILSLLLQVALAVFLVRWAIGFFRRQAQPGTVPMSDFRPNAPVAASAPASGPAVTPGVELSSSDLSTFEGLLNGIQTAWSVGDIAGLHRLATPELAGYMEEQLRENTRKGVQNRVEQVRLLKGDVLETWREGTVDYATVSLKWSAVDYTVRMGGTDLVSGDATHPSESAEVWTLVRHLNGPWQLSAIQQV
ncbi:TIM44-like domain-containing protein [Telmatospirillum siberiense]|uniref:Tim44-like domain-containing protein n=1 Tax=Telmatospirillum siberiense TaxID=382514 RepID=A0A2N3PXD4_9PROT|nr:TIM44-like domain-containing protein [Telmatospirillum siberiense]PKU25041.1 hypothetical protein CWS72_07450 [Telmatospirillum siberiense]